MRTGGPVRARSSGWLRDAEMIAAFARAEMGSMSELRSLMAVSPSSARQDGSAIELWTIVGLLGAYFALLSSVHMIPVLDSGQTNVRSARCHAGGIRPTRPDSRPVCPCTRASQSSQGQAG